MKKSKLIVLLSILFVILVAVISSLIIAMHMITDSSIKGRQYQERLIECNALDLTITLEKTFKVVFSEDIENFKATKSPPRDGSVRYILKFNSTPYIVEKFLESFPKTRRSGRFKPYISDEDRRHRPGTWPPPDWFTMPIYKGKVGRYGTALGSMDIYIDTTENEKYIIYLYGSYTDIDYSK